MSIINQSLLLSLEASLGKRFTKTIAKQFEKEAESSHQYKSRLSTSTSALSKTRLSNNAERGSSKYSNKQQQITRHPSPTSEIRASIKFGNSKAIYYQTNDLPSLHSMDSATNECIKHSKTKRNINQNLESSDLLNIEQLQVFYCEIDNLRLFGTGWKIKTLSVIGCKLKDLSGINGFLNLQSLFVSYNRIETLSDIAFNFTIRVIDLQGNLLDQMDQVEYLLTLDQLQLLNIDYNPIMSRRKEIIDLFGDKLDTQQINDHNQDGQFLEALENYEALRGFQNVLLIDHISRQLSCRDMYKQIIDAVKKDKYADFTQKQLNLDGRFETEVQIQEQHQNYLLDDLTMYYNPKKALQKDSIAKYLTLKFTYPEEPGQNINSKIKMFGRRSSTKKQIAENQEHKDRSLLTSKVSIKNQDLGSTRGFNPSTTITSSNTFAQTIGSNFDSQKKRKFILRKTSLKKDNKIISTIQSPSGLDKQIFYKTSSFINK